MRNYNQLPSLSRVYAGADAVLECPIGPTYNRIDFECSGTALDVSHIGKIEVRIDGTPVHEYKDLTRLIDFNGYYNRGTETVALWSIYFNRLEMEGLIYKRLPGLGTLDVRTLDVQIHLNAGFPADGQIVAYADTHEGEPLGVFIKVREFAYASAVSGDVEVDKIPRGPRIVAAHFFKSDIDRVKLKASTANSPNREYIDATKAALEHGQKRARPVARVPITAKATHVDHCLEGDMAQSLVTAGFTDMRYRLTLGTAGAVDIVVEYLDMFDGQASV